MYVLSGNFKRKLSQKYHQICLETRPDYTYIMGTGYAWLLFHFVLKREITFAVGLFGDEGPSQLYLDHANQVSQPNHIFLGRLSPLSD